MKPHTMTDGQRQLIKRFVAAFKKLKDKKGDAISRNARLLDIRYRLTLDLRISIETEYSSTNTKSVHDVYELLFRFLDLWNVYEVCCAYGRELGVCGESKESVITKISERAQKKTEGKRESVGDAQKRSVERKKGKSV